jgi:hypothetical protein
VFLINRYPFTTSISNYHVITLLPNSLKALSNIPFSRLSAYTKTQCRPPVRIFENSPHILHFPKNGRKIRGHVRYLIRLKKAYDTVEKIFPQKSRIHLKILGASKFHTGGPTNIKRQHLRFGRQRPCAEICASLIYDSVRTELLYDAVT